MDNPFPDSTDPEAFRALIEEIGNTYMPFGMFGPEKYPPHGVVLYDLPSEYLVWFKERGYPKGKLGQLMSATCEIKCAGLDSLFTPFRRARGGRTLGKKYPKNITFE